MTFRYPALVGGAAAVAASLLIHILPAWFCSWSEPGVEPETVCILDLESRPGSLAGNDKPEDQRLDPDLVNRSSPSPKGEGLQISEAPALIQVQDQERNTAVDMVLSRIRERLQPVWEKSHPPETGQVELCLELTHRGEVHAVWITNVYGSSQLADFILELVQEAGPYPLAGEHIADRLTVGCTFAVEGK